MKITELCHSDLSVINGDRPRPMPMAIGHEAAATELPLSDPGDPPIAVGEQVVFAFLPAAAAANDIGGAKDICAMPGRGRTARRFERQRLPFERAQPRCPP